MITPYNIVVRKISNPIAQALLFKAKKAEDAAWKALFKLIDEQKTCEHKFVSIDPYDPTDQWFSSICYCEKCGKPGETWWCPKSPRGECDYKQPDGSYNPDNCIYCGLPDERT